MDFINLPIGMGEITTTEAGSIHIASAKLVDDATIEIQAADGFESIMLNIIFPVRLARLEYTEDGWYFTASLNIPDRFREYADDCIVSGIKNQEAAQVIKIFLDRHSEQEVSA